MKKIIISIMIIFAFITNVDYVSAADYEVVSVASGKASKATEKSELIDRTGGTIDSKENIDGIRISLVDEDGNMISGTATFDVFFKNDRHANSKKTFYNKNGSKSNKASVMSGTPNYEWAELTKNTLSQKNFDVKFKVGSTEYQLTETSLKKYVDNTNDFYELVARLINTDIKNIINNEWNENNAKKRTTTDSILSKFGILAAQYQNFYQKGVFLTVEPISTYQFGNDYYVKSDDWTFYKIYSAAKDYMNSSDDDKLNAIKNSSYLKSDFKTSVTSACQHMVQNFGNGTPGGSYSRTLPDECDRSQEGIKQATLDCQSDIFGTAFTNYVNTCKTNSEYNSVVKTSAHRYFTSLKNAYDEGFKDVYNDIVNNGKSPEKNDAGLFYFVGTPSELYEFNNDFVNGNDSANIVKTTLQSYCEGNSYLKNDCTNYLSKIQPFGAFKTKYCFKRFQMTEQLVFKNDIKLKYTACNIDKYSSSSIGCGIIAVAATYPPDNEDYPDNCDEYYDDILALDGKKWSNRKNALDNTKIYINEGGEEPAEHNLGYCCYSDPYSTELKTEKLSEFDVGGEIYNVCHDLPKSCTYEDFLAVLAQDNWGDDPDNPANKLLTDKIPSGYVSKKTEDALYSDKLYVCCNFSRYSDEEKLKIKAYFLEKKWINSENDKLKKPFNNKLKLICNPPTVNDSCNIKDYQTLKGIIEGTKTKETLVHYNNEDTVYYACCKGVTSIGTNKEVIIDQNKLKDVWDLEHYNENNSGITDAQKIELENIIRMACPADDTENPKCDYQETIAEGLRYGGKNGNLDCCDYKNIEESTLPYSINNETKFNADIKEKAETYEELKACVSTQYCQLNSKREFITPPGKSYDWCCYNYDGQWQDDEYYRTTIWNDQELKNKYNCTVNYCDWSKLMNGEVKQNGTDCCKLSGFEENNNLYTNIRTKLAADGKTVNGKKITNKTKLSVIKSNLEDSFSEAVEEFCSGSNILFCSYNQITNENKDCCDNYDRYSDSDKAIMNNYSGSKVEKLHQFLAAQDLISGENRYKNSCVPPCAASTIVACPNCSKIVSGTRNVETSYDTIESTDSTIRNTTDEIKECIVSNELFNSTVNESIGNEYCPVYCTEKIVYDYPKGLESVEAGRQYYLAPAYITTVKTCRINNINTELFLTHLNSYYDQILEAYEDYKKWEQAIVQSKITTITYSSTDTKNNCGCRYTYNNKSCCKATSTVVSQNCTIGDEYEASMQQKQITEQMSPQFIYQCTQSGGSVINYDGKLWCQKTIEEFGCTDGSTPSENEEGKMMCPGVKSCSCTAPNSTTYPNATLTNSSTCTYTYCSSVDNTKWNYQLVNEYTYGNGVDPDTTNKEETPACIVNDNTELSTLYSNSYPSKKEAAWNKVMNLYGKYLEIIQKLKDCFNIPDVIKDSVDYDFEIEAEYNQANYNHVDKMLKELVSTNINDQDAEMLNRTTLTFKKSQTQKITIDQSRNLTVGTLSIDNVYSGDLSNRIYSLKVERQYKYTLTTGYNYTLKGSPLSVKEKEKELQEIAIATHLPVSYEDTEDGTIELRTSLANSSSKQARSDLTLCTVEENSEYAYTCNFSVYDRLILDPGVLPVYRPIRLSNPFPDQDGNGRNTGVNWCQDSTNCSNNPNVNNVVKTYITNNRDVTEEQVYNLTPLYTIKLTPMDIQNIRNYNKSTNYNDFRLVCDPDTGLNCQSIFLRGTYSRGYNASEEPYSTPGGVINNITNLIVRDKSCALYNASGMNCRLDGQDLFAGGMN